MEEFGGKAVCKDLKLTVSFKTDKELTSLTKEGLVELKAGLDVIFTDAYHFIRINSSNKKE